MSDHLENVEVFRKVTEALRFVVDNHKGSEKSSAYIQIRDSKIPENEIGLPGEISSILPVIEVHYINGERPRYTLIMRLAGFTTRYGGPAYDCWERSRYADLFSCHIDEMQPGINLYSDIEDVVDFVSYYMRLFGYENDEDFTIGKTFTLQEADMARIKISDDITVPCSLLKAMAALKKWGITSNEDLMISLTPAEGNENSRRCDFFIYFDGDEVNLSWECFFGEDRLEILKRYHNYAMLDVMFMDDEYLECGSLSTTDADYAMRFMTDYYLHFIDDDAGELSVECNFSWMILDDDYDIADSEDFFIYRFNADGTESTSARLECCMKILELFREDQ